MTGSMHNIKSILTDMAQNGNKMLLVLTKLSKNFLLNPTM